MFLRSGIIYKFQCDGFNAIMIKRNVILRSEYKTTWELSLTGEKTKGYNDSAIKEHLLFCNHSPDFEDFSFLTTKNNDIKVMLMESLLINRDHPPLSKRC